MTPNALPVAQRTAPKHCSALVANKSEDSCCLLEESQRTVKEVWELSRDVFYNSPIHIDTISVFVSYACKACLQFDLPMTMLRIVRVCHDQLRQRQVIGSCLTQSAVETDVMCTITIVFFYLQYKHLNSHCTCSHEGDGLLATGQCLDFSVTIYVIRRQLEIQSKLTQCIKKFIFM